MKSNSIPIPGTQRLAAIDEEALAHTWAHNLRISSSPNSSEGESNPGLPRPDSAAHLPQGSLSPEDNSPVVLRPPLPAQAEPGGVAPALSRWISEGGPNAEFARRRAAHQIQKCLNGQSTALHLGQLGLPDLPNLVWELTELTELHIGENALSHLPREIGNLKKLTHLTVSDNKLTFLPSEISQLTDLQVLDVSANWLRDLPEGFGMLKALRWLYLCENPITPPERSLGRLHEDCMIFVGARARKDEGPQSTQTFPDRLGGPHIVSGG